MKHLLILNNGSSSLRFAVFELKKKISQEVLAGSFSLINSKSVLVYNQGHKKYKINYQTGYNLKNWWHYLHDVLTKYDIVYVGVRLVHGGEEFVDTTRVDGDFLKRLVKYNDLAPLHNPAALELVGLVKDTWPRVKIAASFDTAWYKDLPQAAYLYSLPLKYYRDYKIRKYGFHGLSHEAATLYAAKVLGKKLNKLKVITCHLGSGNSLTWYMDGQVKDTTMGFSPNEGLTMATRSGDVPVSIAVYLANQLKMPLDKIEKVLNEQSGLLGLAGTADLRNILLACGYKVAGFKSSWKFSAEQKKLARLALDIYIYDIRRYLASYLAMSKSLDAIVFTGTVGVASQPVRKLVLSGLSRPKHCQIIIASEGEMKNLAEKTNKCLVK